MLFDRFLLAVESRDLSQADKSIIRVSSFPSFNLWMINYSYTQKNYLALDNLAKLMFWSIFSLKDLQDWKVSYESPIFGQILNLISLAKINISDPRFKSITHGTCHTCTASNTKMRWFQIFFQNLYRTRTREPGPVLVNLNLNRSLARDLFSGTWTRTWDKKTLHFWGFYNR